MPRSVDGPLLETLHSGYITQGRKVAEFENLLGQYIENALVLSLNSGTTAIALALKLAEVGPGDEVISTPMTCVATNVGIVTAGADIVWADVFPDSGLMDWDDARKKITKRTKAILTVDWAGYPVEYDNFYELTGEFGLRFISDAAHSLGASYRGKRIGSPFLADFTCFSFQAIKTITTVDGGALAFDEANSYHRGKLLRWFGVDRENKVQFRGEMDVPEAGWKYHMNDINATIGIVQLQYLNDNVARQRSHANLYMDGLSDYYRVAGPADPMPGTRAAHWLMPVLLPGPQERDRFQKHMQANDIEVSQVHWRNDRHTAFQKYETLLPGVDAYSSRQISIPNHSQLTRVEIREVIDVMNAFAEGDQA